jgi:hypothetical protein
MKKAVLGIGLTAALALTTAGTTGAEDGDRCVPSVTGTYLATIVDATTKEFASRALITLSRDQNLSVIDSNESGNPGEFAPFTDSQGVYRCVTQESFKARALNFSFPAGSNPSNIARGDYEAAINLQTGVLAGSLRLCFFALEADPTADCPGEPTAFEFTGHRLTAE